MLENDHSPSIDKMDGYYLAMAHVDNGDVHCFGGGSFTGESTNPRVALCKAWLSLHRNIKG